ncbi:amidase [Solirubrobacter ginsenosidimutans]|uniref:Amidase n=1 Tax=Solirubrobacter ginsenosidimutans TaxID=490573 RepID=A0A9X3MVI5_9ACTN|nr:amidase [Solirubrobacter ginsenosidimutans]MDA0162108.1 amidase [Solirubrobacter ginsenosidimutans]
MKRSLAALVAGTAVLAAAVPASAVTTITTANGLNWQIHDFAPPKLDTGSIRAITDNAFYGFGGIRVRVSGIPATDTTARFNGELMRGFNLGYDGDESFTTAQPVVLGGIAISRAVKVSKAGNYSRFLDTFANTSTRTITVDVAFGGSAGQNSGSAQSKVVDSSSGDTAIGADDSWVEVANPSATGVSNRGPSAVVNGTQSGTGNFQRDPFGNPLPLTGLEANFYGYKNTLTLAPGQTKSLLRYVVAGRAEAAATAGQQVAAVKTGATTLASAPDIAGIPAGVGCTVANWAPLYDAATCAASPAPAVTPEQPTKLPVTTSGYDVFNKSITQLAADMKSGLTTSQAITRAYLDRIAAYDSGPFGFHAFITVSDTAMAQAKAADDRRAAGDTSELLGIPVAVKDLYDTKDMPTTDGSLAFEGWRPERDAGQVKRLRDAGAVIIGKTNLSEFANSGSYSDSGYGMVWNAFKPSKTSLGSSGGSAVATALSLTGFAMGTQTGVSLYAPSTGASLVSLRGTDGISSGAGVMPLTWLQDFEGPIARTTSDVARILNVTTGTDPDDIATVHADADHKRPADWKTALDPNALQGKKIGYVPSAFDASPSYGQEDGTIDALKARFNDLIAAGATMVPVTAAAPASPATGTLTGSRTEEGWQRYFDLHANPPYHTASEILSSPKVLPYNRGTQNPAARLTAADIDKIFAQRDEYKARWKTYMDTAGVDAIVYPGFRSDVYDNDGAQTLSSDRNSGVPTSNVGLPTLILPVGANPHGDPMSLQFVGRAWDDAKMLGFGYALEQQLGGAGHLVPATAPKLAVVTQATAPVGGQVPATLALTMGAPATFGAFTPGIAKDYTATTTANVISTAGDAALTVSDPGHLANGTFALAAPLTVAFSKAVWTGPVSNDAVTVTFGQHIGATDPLRTGAYSKTLTYTLSTTTP